MGRKTGDKPSDRRIEKKELSALLADSQQTLLDGVPLGFGERAAFGQSVDGLKCGVDQLSVVLRAAEESGTAGQQRQQRRADVPVHGQRRLSGAQHLLRDGQRDTCSH